MAVTKSALRAVEPGETSKPNVSMTILEAAEVGDRLEELRSMRRRIATAMDDPNTPARDLAALSRRQMEIGRDVDALLAREKEQTNSGSVSDDAFNAKAI